MNLRKTKKVAVLQSNYIPWKGYFDLIASVDEFIIFDDMQYTRRDWRNRNQIKTAQGPIWLTVPVQVKGKFHQKIRETRLGEPAWSEAHWKTLETNYRRSPFFEEIATWLKPSYTVGRYTHLSPLNFDLIKSVCLYLGIDTKITNSFDYTLLEGKAERLADLCVQAGATEYVSGPAAKDYIDEGYFSEQNLKLTWFDYNGYPEYPQLWGEFTHRVSVIDLLFNCGPDAGRYMKFIAP